MSLGFSLLSSAYKHFNFTEGEKLRRISPFLRGLSLDSRDADDLAGGHHDQERSAGIAFVVGVHSVVRLLLAHELERLVVAGGHARGSGFRWIYAFGGAGF
jgi:hypothetical protein